MLAIVKTQAGDGFVELRGIPESHADPGWLVLEVAACGLCGTDVHIIHGCHTCFPPVVLETVAVVGPGPLGLLGALATRELGSARVVVVGRPTSRARLEAASRLGLEVRATGTAVGASWDAALSLLKRAGVEVASLTTSFALTSWTDALAAMEERRVVKPLLRRSLAELRPWRADSAVSPEQQGTRPRRQHTQGG